jgi:hypothetical protein
MDRNIESYAKVFNVLDKEKCELAVKLLKENEEEFEIHTFYDSMTETTKSYDNELSCSFSNIETKKYFMDRIYFSLGKYMEELKSPYLSGWKGYSELRFNKYDTNTQMREHCDHIHSMFDGKRKGIPILSIVGVLNDDYKGGEFIMWQDTEIKLKTGDILIFPSVFLYPHKVNLVTEGKRYSFVSWTW